VLHDAVGGADHDGVRGRHGRPDRVVLAQGVDAVRDDTLVEQRAGGVVEQDPGALRRMPRGHVAQGVADGVGAGLAALDDRADLAAHESGDQVVVGGRHDQQHLVHSRRGRERRHAVFHERLAVEGK
jgi:hypothetical protein